MKNDQIYNFANAYVIRISSLLSMLLPQTSGVGIGVKGLDGRYQLVNEAMENLLGQSAEQITGTTDAQLFSADLATKLQQSDQDIMAGAAAASVELEMTIHGTPLRCLWLKFPVLGPQGKILFIGAVMLDLAHQNNVTHLQQSIVQLQQTNQELQKSLVALDRLASTDKLTGAWNRRRLDEAVTNEMDRLKRYDHPLSLLVIDIDFFKRVNDERGHAVGDQVLAKLAQVIQSALRTTDSLTRWGGEEFIVLCPNTTLSTVRLLAKRLHEMIAKTVFPVVQQLTVSMGAAECTSGETWTQWFDRADAALYRAKAGGRNQLQVAPETPQGGNLGEKVSAHFVKLSWHQAYECGNAVIDGQHQGLFNDANELLGAMLSTRPTDEVLGLIDTLIGHAVTHFEQEEAIFTAAGFPGALEHAALHRDLVNSALKLVERFEAGSLAMGELFQFLAHTLVARHMLGADREFFPCLEAKN